MEVDKLKVTELRAELSSRGLDTKGVKTILVARLKEFLASSSEETDTAATASSEEAATDAAAVPQVPPAVEEAQTEASKVVPEPAIEEATPEVVPEPTTLEPVLAATTVEAAAAGGSPAKKEVSESVVSPPQEVGDEPAAALAPAAVAAAAGEEKEEEATQEKMETNEKVEKSLLVVENEPEIDESLVCLDWYDSDLSMRISKDDFVTCDPFHRDGWGYVWSGARATYGFTAGKVSFEVKLVDHLECKLEGEKRLHELRVGWSTKDDATLQLGEAANSFAYAGSGRKAVGNAFQEYGATFAKDDVVAAFVDLDSDPVVFAFAKNGQDQGPAFSVPKAQLEGKPVFPHVSSRNVKFSVNFGNEGLKREPPLDSYTCAADASHKVRNTPRIANRQDCEMIMLIGLPGCGKTTWINKYVAEHPDKSYNVIGTSTLIERMKVDGEPRKKHHDGKKWDVLIQRATRCLQEWLRTASQRRRNVIIDQTNVYPNAQRRKVRPFEGMIRKAVVVVPSDEDYKARIEAQEKDESKDVPDNAVMEMKANFTLPAEGDDCPFKEISFVELQRDEAAKLIGEYNKIAKEKGFGKANQGQRKRLTRMRGNLRMMNRGGASLMRGGRGGGFPLQRGGMMMMRGRGGRGGGPMRFPRGMPMRGMMHGMGPMMPPRPRPAMRGGMVARGNNARGMQMMRGGNKRGGGGGGGGGGGNHFHDGGRKMMHNQGRGGGSGGHNVYGGFRGRGSGNYPGSIGPRFSGNKFGGGAAAAAATSNNASQYRWGGQQGWQGSGEFSAGMAWNQGGVGNQGMLDQGMRFGNPAGMQQQQQSWNQPPQNQMHHHHHHHQQQPNHRFGGGGGNQNQGGYPGNQNQGGYPGNQNWGGFGRF